MLCAVSPFLDVCRRRCGDRKGICLIVCRRCHIRVNRDINASLNMLYLYLYQAKCRGRRPPSYVWTPS